MKEGRRGWCGGGDVSARWPFSDSPTCHQRARAYECTIYTRLYALSTRVSRYPRRRVVEERAVEDIDKIIPTSRSPSRTVPAAHAISGRPRRPFGTSLCRVSLSLSFFISFPPTQAGLTYREKSEKGVVRGYAEKDERGRVETTGRVEAAPVDTAVMILF